MTLPASGTISLSLVNLELSYASNATISLNDAAVRALFGKASGIISLSDGWGKSSFNPARGYLMGGNTGSNILTTEIDGLQFDNEAAINPAAALPAGVDFATGVNSATRGYNVSGRSNSSIPLWTAGITGLQFSNETAFSVSATLSLARQQGTGVNSTTRGYALGGHSAYSTYTAEIDGMVFATEAAINPAAALSIARTGIAGVNSATRGYAMGGGAFAYYDEIDGIQFDTEAAINPAAAITVIGSHGAGINSGTRGYHCGGRDINFVNQTEIDGIQFDNEAVINPAAGLALARQWVIGVQAGAR